MCPSFARTETEKTDDKEDAITIEQVAEYFSEIGITEIDSDIAVYLVSYELKSPSMGRLLQKDFVEGWSALKCVFHLLFFLLGLFCCFQDKWVDRDSFVRALTGG